MSTTTRDVLLGAVLALWFPAALAVTDAACSEPGDLGTPTQEPAPAPRLSASR